MRMMGLLCGAAMLAVTVPATAGIVYSNTFNDGTAAGFSGGTVITSPSGEQFLEFGGAGGTATLTIAGLAPHTSVGLSFSLYVIGSMDGDGYNGAPIYGGGSGDYFTVGSTAGAVFNQAFANYGNGEVQSYPVEGSGSGAGSASLNALQYTGFPSAAGIQDAEYNFGSFALSSTASSFSFTFTDNSNEGMSNEFYGIDNVVVTTAGGATGTVPEPASWALMLAGFGVVGGVLRRRATNVVAA